MPDKLLMEFTWSFIGDTWNHHPSSLARAEPRLARFVPSLARSIPPLCFTPTFFTPSFFVPTLFFLHHFIFNPTFLPALLKSWSSGKFIDLSESRKPKAESQKPRAESRKQRAVLIWDLFDFSWDLVVLAMFCRCIPALRGPRREPACIDGWMVDGWMDGWTGSRIRKKITYRGSPGKPP